MNHQHPHNHKHHDSAFNVGLAFLLNLGFCIVEVIGGYFTGSIAIISDALHDFGDSLTLGFSYYLEKKAQKKSDATFSYGYRRLSLLAALFSGIILVSGSLVIFAFAIPRLINPVQPQSEGMLALSLLGVAVNGFAAWKVQTGHTMNEKIISWHLLEDVFGWLLILIVSIVMMFVNLPILDPILSILFTSVILYNVLKTTKQTLKLFLQGVPESLDIDTLRQAVLDLPQIINIHDLHVWSLDGQSHVLTMHVVIDKKTNVDELQNIKQKIKDLVEKSGNIHATLEIETQDEACGHFHCVQN